MDLNILSREVVELSKEVGAYIASEQKKLGNEDIDKKGLHDYVTYVDKQSELKLIDGLEGILPGSGFMVEENSIDNTEEEYTWIIDPLDGTTNFIHGLPVFAISIALQKDNQTIYGLVYDIKADECFYAGKGSRAFMNGNEIKVSERNSLDESLLATGFPFNEFSRQKEYVELLAHLMKHTRGIRRYGSAAIDLAWVACGRFDGFFEYNLKPWDVAAGSFILKQAGGIVSDFNGEEDYIFGKEIICGNKHIYPELLDLTKMHFKQQLMNNK